MFKTVVLVLTIFAETSDVHRKWREARGRRRGRGWRRVLVQVLPFMLAGAPAVYHTLVLAHYAGAA